MTITYPLVFPDNLVGITDIKIDPITAVGMTQSPFSFAQQTSDWTGQMWGLQLTTVDLDIDEGSELEAFITALNGRQGTFLIGDPAKRVPRGAATGTPLVDGDSQTGNVLNTKGWTPNTTNILRKSDYIQLGTGASSRLYRLLKDVDSDASGNAVLDIWPRLRVSPLDGDAVIVENTVGRFRLSSNRGNGLPIRYPVIYKGTINAIEAL